MAKKQKTTVEVQDPQVLEVTVEPTKKQLEEVAVMEATKSKRKEPKKNIIGDWEIKNRTYLLKDGSTPLTYSIKANKLFYFDKEKGHEREVALTENQNTPFVDEFKGQVRPGRIIFRNGVLQIPASKVNFQKFMSIYHPSANKIWYEVKPAIKAASHLDVLNVELDAMIEARSLDIDMVEAIMRVQVGSKVSKMTSKELKRDVLLFAKENPRLFLDLCKDENIHIRNVGIKATEMGVLKLSDDQRTFTWASNGRKLMNVPFDEHPYSALASWFKTDEGMEVLQYIEKELK